MTLEQEIRNFAIKYMPGGGEPYLTSQPVPYFKGKTWQDAFHGDVPEKDMKFVFKRLRDIFGSTACN